jgi:N-carbamoyl-L-amino-acid hydrolase
VAARRWLAGLSSELGLSLRTDPIGNMYIRWEGSQPELAAVATGSHIDAIPNSGMYDGTVGVLGGIEAIRQLKAAGFHPVRPIEVIAFSSEEPTRFGLGCSGSRVLSGAMAPADAARLVGHDGITLEEARKSAGHHGKLEDVPLPRNHYFAFIELHIEQGPILEREGLLIGAVEAIAAPATLRLVLTGEGGHAGAVLMPERRDALCAAAEVVLAVERTARESGSPNAVATVGLLNVFPGAVNSVPLRVTMEIDVRDTNGAVRDALLDRIMREADRICISRKIDLDLQVLNADPPATCDPRLVATIEDAARRASIPYRRMVSRAYHDSLFMARIAPTAMIFIPCRNGVSHRPDEYAPPEALAAGVEVLAQTLATLSSNSGGPT